MTGVPLPDLTLNQALTGGDSGGNTQHGGSFSVNRGLSGGDMVKYAAIGLVLYLIYKKVK